MGSASRRFQPGEGPSRGLLCGCTTGYGTDGSICGTSPDVQTLRPLEVDQDEAHVNVPVSVCDLARRCDGRVSQLLQ